MNRLRLACGDRSFPLAPFELALDLIKGLGFEAADLYVSPRSQHLPLAMAPSMAERVAAQLEARRLAVADVLLELTGGEDIEPLMGFVDRCGARHATMLVEEYAAPSVERFAASALARGITPAVQIRCVSPQATAAILDAVSGLALTLDYGHYLTQGYGEDQVNELLPRVSHLHARGVAPGVFQTAWAENTVNWKAALDTLAGLDYRGFFAAAYLWEPERGWNRNDTIGETAALRRSLQAL